MAAVVPPEGIESTSRLKQLFQDVSLNFNLTESEAVVQLLKKNYGGKFNSLDNQDLLSGLQLLEKYRYVSDHKLTFIEKFVAPKCRKEGSIHAAVNKYKASYLAKPDPEMEFFGRKDEIQKISKKLSEKTSIINLFGSAGVGKTRLAEEVCSKWRGQHFVFDLRDAKDMTAIYLRIMNSLKMGGRVGSVDLSDVVRRIHNEIRPLTSKDRPILFLLDNLEEHLISGQGGLEERKKLNKFFKLLTRFDEGNKQKTLKLLLTSRTQLKDNQMVKNFEVMSFEHSFSEKLLFHKGRFDVKEHQKEKLIRISKGVPLILNSLAAIFRQERKTVDDFLGDVHVGEVSTLERSKVRDIGKEKTVSFEEDGIDEWQLYTIREMFDTLPTDILKVSAVSVSLFHGPFKEADAAKVLGISQSEAFLQLEGLVASGILSEVDENVTAEKKDNSAHYDIHPLLKKYADSLKAHKTFQAPYTEAKARFHELFMSRIEKIAKLIDLDYVRAFTLFEKNRGNYEFAIDISLQPEFFRLPGEFRENALIASLFCAMVTEYKLLNLFHSWAEMCEDDGKTGSLGRAQLKCWEAKQVVDVHGTKKAFEVLREASRSMEKVEDKSAESFKLTKGFYLHSEGEILWRNGDHEKALASLQLSLTFSEELLIEHTDLARCYNAIGNCQYSLNKLEEALEFYHKAYKMQEKLAGSEHHFDMPMYNNQIGTVYEGQGDYEMAIKYYNAALKLLHELKLSGSWDEAHFCRNLANALMNQMKHSEAVEPANRAYDIRMKIVGNHPLTVRSIFQRAVIQVNLSKYKKALKLFLEAWEMEKTLEPGNHSVVWRKVITGVEDMCDFLKKRKQKERFRKEALEFCEGFWEGQRCSQPFSFSDYNREIIDTILELAGDKKSVNKYKAEKEWFYERYTAAKEDFRGKSNQSQSAPCHSASEGDERSETKYGGEDDTEEEVEIEVDSTDEDDAMLDTIPANKGKTQIGKGEITNKGDTWDLPEAGASITFFPGFVKEPLLITCSLWSLQALSPPIGSNEVLVSNVIELSHDGPPDLEFMEDAPGRISVALLHSASNFKGYEVAIKQLVDLENNEWKDLETRNVWHPSEHVPDWMCQFAEATLKKTCFSSFAAIWRLKSLVFFKPTSMIPELTCTFPDYPNVSVVLPWSSVSADKDFRLTLKAQEPPKINQHGEELLVGPILHISCSHDEELFEPAEINVPLALFEGKKELVNVHSGLWRVLHFKSTQEKQQWTDITDQLDIPVFLTDGIVKFQVKTFCRFWLVFFRQFAGNVIGTASQLTTLASRLYEGIAKQRADFLAFLHMRIADTVPTSYILKVVCFPSHSRYDAYQIIKLSNIRVIFQGGGTSDEPLSNGERTKVSLSDGFKLQGAGQDTFLTFGRQGPVHKDICVTIADKTKLTVDFQKCPACEDNEDSLVLCSIPLYEDIEQVRSWLDAPSTSQVASEKLRLPRTSQRLKVILIADEWTSLAGGLSTFNRELAINLAKQSSLEVTLFVPKNACHPKHKEEAKRHNVTILEAKELIAYDPREGLNFPSPDLKADVVIGHGQKLGRQGQIFQASPSNSKWIQVVHTYPEELGTLKDSDQPIYEGRKKQRNELDLCKIANLVVTVGPKLRNAYSSRLPDQNIFTLTPGLFKEFESLQHVSKRNSEFKVLLCGRADPEDFELKGYDIAAKAFASGELKFPLFRLVFVGTFDGKQDKIRNKFLECGIDKKQLFVREFVQSREEMKELLGEVQLALMPSQAEGFGLVALEALSAGLPVLVGRNSGFAEAIKDLRFAKSFIVESENPRQWAEGIKKTRLLHEQRLKEILELRESYGKQYSWDTQCEDLVKKMKNMVYNVE